MNNSARTIPAEVSAPEFGRSVPQAGSLPHRYAVGALLLTFFICSCGPAVCGQETLPATPDPGPEITPVRPEELPDNSWQGPLSLPDPVHYQRLPSRIDFDPPTRSEPPDLAVLSPLTPLYQQVLSGDYDDELVLQTLQSVARMGRLGLTDAEPFAELLADVVRQHPSRIVRETAAVAVCDLSAAEAAQALGEAIASGAVSDPGICDRAELFVAEAGSSSLDEVWRSRLQSPQTISTAQLKSACRCAAVRGLSDAAEQLSALALNETLPPASRLSAGAALSDINAESAAAAARQLLDGRLADQLTAARLLRNAADDEALSAAERLADSEISIVASEGYTILAAQAPQRILPRLPQSTTHPEANVRLAVISALTQLPSEQHCTLLSGMTGDRNLFVRSRARTALASLIRDQPELNSTILGDAMDVAASEDSSWEAVEQALHLLGQARDPNALSECIRLLQHPRPEVSATAAWVMHLMPESGLGPEANAAAVKLQTAAPNKSDQDIWIRGDHTLRYLFLYLGWARITEASDVTATQFPRADATSEPTRAAGVWAHGAMVAGSDDPQRLKMCLERMNDTEGMFPEHDEVRRAAILAIGELDGKSVLDQVRDRYQRENPYDDIGAAIRHVVERLEGEPLPEPPPAFRDPGNWSPAPATDPVAGNTAPNQNENQQPGEDQPDTPSAGQ